jgi:hypothetical protein
VLALSNDHLVYAASAEGSSVTVALNLSQAATELDVPASSAVILAGDGHRCPGRNAVALPPRGWAVLGAAG